MTTRERLRARRAKVLARARKYDRKARLNSRRAKRARARAAGLKERITAARNAETAVKWALSQAAAGVVEHPPASNWGVPVSDWIRASGYSTPVPWCQCFANAVAVHGKCTQIKTGYTPWVMGLNPAVAGIEGFEKVSLATAKPGDFVFFKWAGVSRDPCDHVGIFLSASGTMVHTVEGNTSPGNGGSQADGGGTFLRDRAESLVVGVVRPPWPTT